MVRPSPIIFTYNIPGCTRTPGSSINPSFKSNSGSSEIKCSICPTIHTVIGAIEYQCIL
ncbi:hypothetical protein GYB22_08340 [bacterium]|nr:hypothetical protein [bacterium]